MIGTYNGTLLSSGDAWAGLMASFVALDAGSLEIRENDAYRVAVHVGRPHRLWDQRDGAACVGAHARGDVVITTLGERRFVRWDRASSLMSLRLEPDLIGEIAASTGADPKTLDIAGCFGHRDPVLESAAFALFRELAANMPCGRLFGEEIAATIAARLIERHARGTSRAAHPGALERRGGLSKISLSRVLAFMHDAMSERISLAALANLTDLSTYHFARQFRLSVGIAPHAYLVRVRVEEAMRALLLGAQPSDAAASVGFSSQGHLTHHMRRALGVTPRGLMSITKKKKKP